MKSRLIEKRIKVWYTIGKMRSYSTAVSMPHVLKECERLQSYGYTDIIVDVTRFCTNELIENMSTWYSFDGKKLNKI